MKIKSIKYFFISLLIILNSTLSQTIPIEFHELGRYPIITTCKYHPVARIDNENFLLPRKDASSGFGSLDYLVFNYKNKTFSTIDSTEESAKGLYESRWMVSDCISIMGKTFILGIYDYYIPKVFLNNNGVWGKWKEWELDGLDSNFGYNALLIKSGKDNDLYIFATVSNNRFSHFYYSSDNGDSFKIDSNRFKQNLFKHYIRNFQIIEKGLIYHFNRTEFFRSDLTNNMLDSQLILDTISYKDYVIFDVHFKDRNNGLVLAYKNFPFEGVVGVLNLRVFETTNGGVTFYEKANVDMPRPVLTDIKKVHTSGNILQYYNDQAYYILSTDYGKTWEYYDYQKDTLYPSWIYSFFPIEDGKKYLTYSFVNVYEVKSNAVPVTEIITSKSSLYPNPVSDFAWYKLEDDFSGVISISIIDLLGNSTQIYSGEVSGGVPLNLDFSTFPTGFYSLIIDYGTKREAVKVIKQ